MDALIFRSFVKTAMELQADQDTPRDYTMVKAAAEIKYGISKEAASEGWIRRMTSIGAAKASPQRLSKFIDNRNAATQAAQAAGGAGYNSHTSHVIQSNSHASSQAQKVVDARSRIGSREGFRDMSSGGGGFFGGGIQKKAWNTGELTGLGILAAPSASNLAGHPWGEKAKDVSEVTGLGLLAAPYAHNIAAGRSARYANSGIGRGLTRAFSH